MASCMPRSLGLAQPQVNAAVVDDGQFHVCVESSENTGPTTY